MLIWFDRLTRVYVILCLSETMTILSVKPKAPFLENKDTKCILCRHSEKCSEMLQSGDGGLILVAVLLGEVLARSGIAWDLHPSLQL